MVCLRVAAKSLDKSLCHSLQMYCQSCLTSKLSGQLSASRVFSAMKEAAKDGMDPTMDMNVKKPSMLEFMGLAGNFGHLNLRDPFDVKKRGSSYVTEIRAGHGVRGLMFLCSECPAC